MAGTIEFRFTHLYTIACGSLSFFPFFRSDPFFFFIDRSSSKKNLLFAKRSFLLRYFYNTVFLMYAHDSNLKRTASACFTYNNRYIYILYNLYFLMYPKTWQQIASCPRRSFIKETRMGNSIALSFYTLLSYVVSIPASFIRLSSIFYFLTSFNLIVLYRRNRDSVKFAYTYIIYCLTINSSPLFRWGTTEQKFWSSVFFLFFV